jgi:hypothetical protein
MRHVTASVLPCYLASFLTDNARGINHLKSIPRDDLLISIDKPSSNLFSLFHTLFDPLSTAYTKQPNTCTVLQFTVGIKQLNISSFADDGKVLLRTSLHLIGLQEEHFEHREGKWERRPVYNSWILTHI